MWVWGAILLLCAINREKHPFVSEGAQERVSSATVIRWEVETFSFPENVCIFPSAIPDMSEELVEGRGRCGVEG
jgi:hypothetical protein